MGIKVKGIYAAQKEMEKMLNDVTGRKAVRAVTSALLIIGAESAVMVPMDTGTLVNSQFRDVKVSGTRVIGKVGYSAEYALSVHNAPGKLKGKPRAHFGKTGNHSDLGPMQPKDFGGGSLTGNYWDPRGEPKFLDKAVDRTKELVAKTIKKELSL
ncbi:HK97 gp10 family phage protein [Yersinia kristensenii]|uniref:HK97 gp10 family phage protein n=1 Tax=Yersinia kristensenii TaxID=28152 RepID=UPI0011A48821|nr:HK97 gp10 family phage protein [Yersinia kristensenii]MBW5843421.1 HK97 gp10 family phage protein [Yersinia kristensenii]MDR4898164.1 HK97 gp10 family phage protein [Yersinia kristensenii]